MSWTLKDNHHNPYQYSGIKQCYAYIFFVQRHMAHLVLIDVSRDFVNLFYIVIFCQRPHGSALSRAINFELGAINCGFRDPQPSLKAGL